MSLFLMLGLISTFNPQAQAKATDPRYFQMEAPQIEIIDESFDESLAASLSKNEMLKPSTEMVQPIAITLDAIVTVGKLIWNIVEANKPVVNIATNNASAVPSGIQNWQDLQGWSMPAVKTFKATYKNKMGMEVVTLNYKFIYTYGGNLDGKGKFLSNVTLSPVDINVLWGYNVNASVKVDNVTNVGTKVDPIAAMQVELNWTVDNVLQHSGVTRNFYVRGDGQYSRL